jgi:CRP-like cAMP-binding protein
MSRDSSPRSETRSHDRLEILAARFPQLPREAIEELGEGATLLTFPTLSCVVSETRACGAVCFLVEGWTCRYMTTSDGRYHLCAILVPGDVCNLDTIVFDRSDYGVRALSPVRVLAIPTSHAIAVSKLRPDVSRSFLELACLENTILAQSTLRLGRRSALTSLAHLLCELSVRLGCAEAGDTSRFHLPLTQEQLGDALGLTSVHVNRTLKRLHAEALVIVEARTVTIPSIAALREICDFDPTYLHAVAASTKRDYPRSGAGAPAVARFAEASP